MKDDEIVFTEEELDFIKEMMNIGAGNAATALEQMLGLKIDLKIPSVKIYKRTDMNGMYQDIGESIQTFTAVFMNLVGDVKGKILFLVGTKDLVKLTSLMEKATPGMRKLSISLDLSIVAEVGNILTGTYLRSIYDFCMLNIYHSVPKLKTDNLKILGPELFPKDDSSNHQINQIILVKNQFITASDRFNTYILLVPEIGSMELIAQSLRQAKDKLSLP
jgi:chemotaxis protein CheC